MLLYKATKVMEQRKAIIINIWEHAGCLCDAFNSPLVTTLSC